MSDTAEKTEIKLGQPVEVHPEQLPQAQVSEANGLMSLVERMAVAPDIDPDHVERAFEMYKQVRAMEAKTAYTEALARFKKNPPKVVKDRLNKQYGSNYASLGNMVNTINEALGENNLSANWDVNQADQITVTCTLTHSMGHSESVSISGPPDKTGSKNPIQEIKSTITYLKLATFESVTGVASVDSNLDDDGNAASGGIISADQAAEIKAELQRTNANVKAFLNFVGAKDVDSMTEAQMKKGMNMLAKKAKKNG